MTENPVDDTLPGYFIAPDAVGELCVWRERGTHPVPILGRLDLRDDPDVWNLLTDAIRTADSHSTPCPWCP